MAAKVFLLDLSKIVIASILAVIGYAYAFGVSSASESAERKAIVVRVEQGDSLLKTYQAKNDDAHLRQEAMVLELMKDVARIKGKLGI